MARQGKSAPAERGAAPDDSSLSEDQLVLSLNELMPDQQGELVLYADDGVPISLLTSEAVAAQGIAESHVTAAGIDVTGLNYLSFTTGITIYFPTELPLTVNYDDIQV